MTSDEHDRAMDHEVSRNDEDILEEVLAEYIDRLNRGEMLDEEHVLLALKPGDGGDRLGVRFLNDVLIASRFSKPWVLEGTNEVGAAWVLLIRRHVLCCSTCACPCPCPTDHGSTL